MLPPTGHDAETYEIEHPEFRLMKVGCLGTIASAVSSPAGHDSTGRYPYGGEVGKRGAVERPETLLSLIGFPASAGKPVAILERSVCYSH
jgi:hypothetical protein